MWFLIECLLFASVAYASLVPKLDKFYPRDQNVGSTFKIFCSPQEGSKPFQFEWRKNGQLLSSSGVTYKIEHSIDDSLFVINQLQTLDSGNYSCTVRNQYGSDTQTTVLTVKGLVYSNLI